MSDEKKKGPLGKTARQFREKPVLVNHPPDEPTLVGGGPAGWEPGANAGSTPDTEPPPAQRGGAAQPPEEEEPGTVEVEVRLVKNPATLTRSPMAVYEIWTRNRVYTLDASLVCNGVIDLASGLNDHKHGLLKSHLVGGQRRTEQGNELCYPLPVPGSEAVFQKPDSKGRVRLVTTSRVTRVLLHVQRVQVPNDSMDETWDQITSRQTIKSHQ